MVVVECVFRGLHVVFFCRFSQFVRRTVLDCGEDQRLFVVTRVALIYWSSDFVEVTCLRKIWVGSGKRFWETYQRVVRFVAARIQCKCSLERLVEVIGGIAEMLVIQLTLVIRQRKLHSGLVLTLEVYGYVLIVQGRFGYVEVGFVGAFFLGLWFPRDCGFLVYWLGCLWRFWVGYVGQFCKANSL